MKVKQRKRKLREENKKNKINIKKKKTDKENYITEEHKQNDKSKTGKNTEEGRKQ